MSGVLRVHLVRHGECDWNRERRYVSHSDRPLTARGEEQTTALAKWLRETGKVKAVVHTGLSRTTAVTDSWEMETRFDPRWREVDHGAWEGLTYRECQARFGESTVAARFADPLEAAPAGGENLLQLAARVREAWESLCDGPSPIAVATHAGPIQALLCLLLPLPLEQHWRWQIDPGSITTLEVHGPSVIVSRVNALPR